MAPTQTVLPCDHGGGRSHLGRPLRIGPAPQSVPQERDRALPRGVGCAWLPGGPWDSPRMRERDGADQEVRTHSSRSAMRCSYYSPKDCLPRAKAASDPRGPLTLGPGRIPKTHQGASGTGAGRQAVHRAPRSSPKKFLRRDPWDRSQKTSIKKLFVFARIVRALASGSYSK